ncbi:hypothetical protein VTN00DRAFT_169 [Thermoascus crustaceus]|uniref:uncharacterized protein n=1 Tax=Thermoascus crustaceus TaxID=5088 RepID=UPI0037433A33
MHALWGIAPTVCAFVAFILSILCLFAGSQKNLIEGADILTLNTSMLGRMQEFDTSVEVAISNIASDGIRDFYSVHVMAYCEGYFEPSAAISLQNPIPKRNVTGCSNRTALFNFHPSEALSRDLKPGANLSDLNWPNAIDDDFKVLDVTNKTMAVLYIIGTAATGVAVLAGGWLIFSGGRLEAIAEVVFTIIGFIALGISSAIATVVAFKFVDLVNRHGKDIGVSATRGSQFLGMTWAAVALLSIGTIASVIMVISGGSSPPPPPPPEEPVKEQETEG